MHLVGLSLARKHIFIMAISYFYCFIVIDGFCGIFVLVVLSCFFGLGFEVLVG
jgi:hypothetical protein